MELELPTELVQVRINFLIYWVTLPVQVTTLYLIHKVVEEEVERPTKCLTPPNRIQSLKTHCTVFWLYLAVIAIVAYGYYREMKK